MTEIIEMPKTEEEKQEMLRKAAIIAERILAKREGKSWKSKRPGYLGRNRHVRRDRDDYIE